MSLQNNHQNRLLEHFQHHSLFNTFPLPGLSEQILNLLFLFICLLVGLLDFFRPCWACAKSTVYKLLLWVLFEGQNFPPWILKKALCPIYTLYAIILNLASSRSWNIDLVPDLGPIGFKGDFKIIQFRYCLLFMLIYVGCNAIYVAALKFIPNMVARRVSHFPTSPLTGIRAHPNSALATTPLCHHAYLR